MESDGTEKTNSTPAEAGQSGNGQSQSSVIDFDSAGKKRRLSLSRGPKNLRSRLKGKVFIVPSMITMIGIFCAFLSIVKTFAGQFSYASVCIGIAIIVDGLDGRVARRLNATSAFGREFDSLSDVIAFGVAPAALMYSWCFANAADEFGIMVSFIYVVCGATRLARFNIATGDSKSSFVGLPIPGAAAALFCFVYMHPEPISDPFLVGFFLAYTIFISFLMVSTMPFFSLKHIRVGPSVSRRVLVLIGAAVALAWYKHHLVIFLVSTAYAMSGPAQYMAGQKKLGWGTVGTKAASSGA